MIKKPDLNITPFVDIMLVLLAILTVSVTATTFEEKQVQLPQGSKTHLSQKKATINIIIKKDGEVLVNSKEYKLENFLENFNLEFGQYDKNSLVYIAGDKNIKYSLFMKIYSDVVKIGFTQIGLLTK
jgi:biopolymer transport protein ExbD